MSDTLVRTPAAEGLRSLYRQDGDPVLQFAHKHGNAGAQGSRFGDLSWELTPALRRENLPRYLFRVDFSKIVDPRQQLTAKEYLWTRLNDRPVAGAHHTRLAPSKANDTLIQLLLFMNFVSQRLRRFSMHDVDQPLLNAYLAHLRSTAHRSPNTLAQLLSVPIDLNRHSRRLTLGSFACSPWSGRSAYRVVGYQEHLGERGNRTPRIPEAILIPLLRWALRYVDVFSPDIIAARSELEALKRARGLDEPASSVRPRLTSYLNTRASCGRGIPMLSSPAVGGPRRFDGIREPAINYPLIALQLGCRKEVLVENQEGCRQAIVDAFRHLGPEMGGLDTEPSVDPETQRPWRDRFDHRSLAHEENMLQAACYIICAYLSGMRDSEVQAMRSGCHVVTKSADGLIERHHIVSRAYKGFGADGVGTRWVTIAPVGRAIAVLEQLTAPRRARRGSDSLWVTLRERVDGRIHLGGAQAISLLNRFRAKLDSMKAGDGSPVVPTIDGRPWRLTTNQFRRTVAWYIANRPFGTIAGKIQYQHASIAMFEGYAGGPPSGLRREIERERTLGQLDDIVEHYEAFKRGLKPTGPASARILREFEHIQQELGDLPGRIVDRQRIRTMLKFFGKNLYVGFLNDCFFEPSTALCLKRSGASDLNAPRLSHCSPDRCPNSCLSHRHLPAWERSIAEAEEMLKNSRLSPLQRKILVAERARMQLLIEPLEGSLHETVD